MAEREGGEPGRVGRAAGVELPLPPELPPPVVALPVSLPAPPRPPAHRDGAWVGILIPRCREGLVGLGSISQSQFAPHSTGGALPLHCHLLFALCLTQR